MESLLLAQQIVAPTNWSELTALGCVLVAFIWGLTKGAPNLIDKFTKTIEVLENNFGLEQAAQRDAFRDEQKESRDAFTQQLERQHAEFRDDMGKQREQSNRLAAGGHEAVNKMAGSVDGLQAEIRELRKEATAESGIHRS